ncbi:metallophosphoesterase [Marvinbryantia formatexigens]|nr:metallophosphoesterase [Marvinbryantia formatexigens]UWO24185.1 metallophosphoesterase [Marvinbryantia formatexigens DSM 14469]SDH39502.1 Calcineurin-like phosphoesterase [Marvinbryantia formatexigens]
MQKISWIHVSDLHLGNDSAVDTCLMRRKLPQYISGLNQTFDYVFCTGDVKEWDTDYLKAADYLRSLCTSSKTTLDHLFVVPGNHDVDIGGDEREKVISRLTNWQMDDYKSNVGIISKTDLALLKSGEDNFRSFVDDLFGADRAGQYKRLHFVVTTEHFNIVHLDTTITYGKGHDRDFIVGTRALMDTLDACDASKPIIILTHYSFDFLAQDERNQVEALLSSYNVQLWFAGHEHENLIRWQREKFLECQCGNLVLQKGARSCFLTGELDVDTLDGRISVHAWYEGKGWEEYPFARVGSENDRVFPFRLRLQGDRQIAGVSEELSNACETYGCLSIAGGIFAGVQLNTAILTDLDCNGKLFVNEGTSYPLARAMETLWLTKRSHPELSCNALILGDGGFGKSTMMYHQCGELLFKQYLAVYISLQAREGANNESIFDYVLRCLYRSTDYRARDKFVHLTTAVHTHPDLVLFIDGFNELSGMGAQRYVAEIKALSRYPGVQIIVSSRLDFLRDYGLSCFHMIRTCGLREKQIKQLFEERPDDWENVEAQKNLRILLKNPMMALLYASTCPILEKYAGLDYLAWIRPISNASDLLHDYYLSQIAILVEREMVDGERIFDSMIVINRILPVLAYLTERRNTTSWREAEFKEELKAAVAEVNKSCFGDSMPESLWRVRRKFRVYTDKVKLDTAYDLMISEMVLLKSGNGIVFFAHQIFRDYLAAVYLHNCLLEHYSVERLWHKEKIHKGVVQYIRYLESENAWGVDGKVNQLLLPYRGKEAEEGNWFVRNVLHCWLSVGDGERDLSFLDLRRVSLSDHLKEQFTGTINIDYAWISKETLINDRHHDRIIGICFSHDNRTLAAISVNGLVSIHDKRMSKQIVNTPLFC